MDGTRLTFGVLPIRRAIRAQGLAALQFLGVASDLHGQDGNAGQSLDQVFNPARIFADDVVHDDPRARFCRRRDAGMESFDERQARLRESRQYGPVSPRARPQQLIDGKGHAAQPVNRVEPRLQCLGKRGLSRARRSVQEDDLTGGGGGPRGGKSFRRSFPAFGGLAFLGMSLISPIEMNIPGSDVAEGDPGFFDA